MSSKRRNKSPIFRRGHFLVMQCYNDTGELYYTVVNTKLDVHRHTQTKHSAMMMCKHANLCVVNPSFDSKYRRNLLYLITGLAKYK